jgi:hypothetical protein
MNAIDPITKTEITLGDIEHELLILNRKLAAAPLTERPMWRRRIQALETDRDALQRARQEAGEC